MLMILIKMLNVMDYLIFSFGIDLRVVALK